MLFFFYFERKVDEETVCQLVDCVEEFFIYKMSELKMLGWCSNYQIQTEKLVMKEVYSKIRVSFPNLLKNRLIKDKKDIEKQNPCTCFMCSCYFS